MERVKIDSDMSESPLNTERPPGPPLMALHIDDTSENVAKALFGIKSDTLSRVTLKRG